MIGIAAFPIPQILSSGILHGIESLLTPEVIEQQLAKLTEKVEFLRGAIKNIDFFPLNFFKFIQTIVQGLHELVAELEQEKEKLERIFKFVPSEEHSPLGRPQTSDLDSLYEDASSVYESEEEGSEISSLLSDIDTTTQIVEVVKQTITNTTINISFFNGWLRLPLVEWTQEAQVNARPVVYLA